MPWTAIARGLRALPAVVRAAAWLLLVGLIVDVLGHVGPVRGAPVTTWAHVLVLAGMVVGLVGSVRTALSSGRTKREEG